MLSSLERATVPGSTRKRDQAWELNLLQPQSISVYKKCSLLSKTNAFLRPTVYTYG